MTNLKTQNDYVAAWIDRYNAAASVVYGVYDVDANITTEIHPTGSSSSWWSSPSFKVGVGVAGSSVLLAVIVIFIVLRRGK